MRKTGRQNGLYRKLLGRKARAKSPPRPGKKWSELSSLENSRLRGVRALWFRKNHASKFKRTAKWVKAIRSRLKMSQKEFAKAVGVSKITVRRWECALGHTPLPRQMKRLKELDS
jgi:ribosome-binding protein aMBF1 (putative translation factor)